MTPSLLFPRHQMFLSVSSTRLLRILFRNAPTAKWLLIFFELNTVSPPQNPLVFIKGIGHFVLDVPATPQVSRCQALGKRVPVFPYFRFAAPC